MNENNTLREIEALIKKKYPQPAVESLMRAVKYAVAAHKGQTRKCQKIPYSIHLLEVTKYLLEHTDPRVDTATIMAAALHDTIEDTTTTSETLTEHFGDEVSSLVQALTKKKLPDKLRADKEYQEQLEREGKRDERVYLIKLSDVLHNAQTLEVHNEKRHLEIKQQIREYYVPLAERLGWIAEAERLKTLGE